MVEHRSRYCGGEELATPKGRREAASQRSTTAIATPMASYDWLRGSPSTRRIFLVSNLPSDIL